MARERDWEPLQAASLYDPACAGPHLRSINAASAASLRRTQGSSSLIGTVEILSFCGVPSEALAKDGGESGIRNHYLQMVNWYLLTLITNNLR